jgi:hypothetical protein
MKRHEESEKIEVACPFCGKKRLTSKKSYVKSGGKLSDQVYSSPDRSCAQKQKLLSAEHKNKISESLKGYKQTELHVQHKSEYMKSHPEAWQNNITTEGNILSEEHKRKISETKTKKV